MKQNRAFTIVEIIIISAVIAILASITVVSYAGLQRNARDKERESDTSILQTSLEEFYEKNGYYPPKQSVAVETDEAVNFLKSKLDMPPTSFIAPLSQSGTKNSIKWSESFNTDSYSYTAAIHDDTSNADSYCELATDQCTKYKISYKKESGEEVVISSKYGW